MLWCIVLEHVRNENATLSYSRANLIFNTSTSAHIMLSLPLLLGRRRRLLRQRHHHRNFLGSLLGAMRDDDQLTNTFTSCAYFTDIYSTRQTRTDYAPLNDVKLNGTDVSALAYFMMHSVQQQQLQHIAVIESRTMTKIWSIQWAATMHYTHCTHCEL